MWFCREYSCVNDTEVGDGRRRVTKCLFKGNEKRREGGKNRWIVNTSGHYPCISINRLPTLTDCDVLKSTPSLMAPDLTNPFCKTSITLNYKRLRTSLLFVPYRETNPYTRTCLLSTSILTFPCNLYQPFPGRIDLYFFLLSNLLSQEISLPKVCDKLFWEPMFVKSVRLTLK